MDEEDSLKTQEETVQVRVDMPISLIQWIDGIKIQLGLSSRGAVLLMLMRELMPDEQAAEDSQQ